MPIFSFKIWIKGEPALVVQEAFEEIWQFANFSSLIPISIVSPRGTCPELVEGSFAGAVITTRFAPPSM